MADQENNGVYEFVCPSCKSTKRCAQIIVEERKASGVMGAKVEWGVTNLKQVPVVDQTTQNKVGDQVDVMVVFQDICADCGTEYIFRIVKELHPIRADVSKLIKPAGHMPNTGGFPPFRLGN